MTKMYIMVKQSLPSHKSVAVAHGVLMCYLKFEHSNEMHDWKDFSFRKVVCEVTDEEFEALKTVSDNIIVTESYFDNKEVAVVFKPREVWPEHFKKYPLANW